MGSTRHCINSNNAKCFAVYVDASPSCNTLAFQLGQNNPDAGGNVASRSWSIKTTQYSCDYRNLAPQGCTQYFFGQARELLF